MDQHLAFGLLAFTSYLTMINPLNTVPVFTGMTEGLDQQHKRRIIIRACLTAFLILVFFALFGNVLFNLFGISANGFRIVGGIIFFMMGYDMLNARFVRMKSVAEPEVQKSFADDITITPLAIPMITGPGAITNTLILMNDANSLALKLILFFVAFTVILIMMLSLLAGSQLTRLIGDTGNKVIVKLMGLIIMVIAVESFVGGLKPILQEIISGS